LPSCFDAAAVPRGPTTCCFCVSPSPAPLVTEPSTTSPFHSRRMSSFPCFLPPLPVRFFFCRSLATTTRALGCQNRNPLVHPRPRARPFTTFLSQAFLGQARVFTFPRGSVVARFFPTVCHFLALDRSIGPHSFFVVRFDWTLGRFCLEGTLAIVGRGHFSAFFLFFPYWGGTDFPLPRFSPGNFRDTVSL